MKTLLAFTILAMVACVPKSMLQPQYAGDDFATVNISSEFPIPAGYVEVDGDPVAEVSFQTLTSIRVEPGKHIITAKNGGGNLNASKKISVKASDEVYLLVILPPLFSAPWIKEIGKDEFHFFLNKNNNKLNK